MQDSADSRLSTGFHLSSPSSSDTFSSDDSTLQEGMALPLHLSFATCMVLLLMSILALYYTAEKRHTIAWVQGRACLLLCRASCQLCGLLGHSTLPPCHLTGGGAAFSSSLSPKPHHGRGIPYHLLSPQVWNVPRLPTISFHAMAARLLSCCLSLPCLPDGDMGHNPPLLRWDGRRIAYCLVGKACSSTGCYALVTFYSLPPSPRRRLVGYATVLHSFCWRQT